MLPVVVQILGIEKALPPNRRSSLLAVPLWELTNLYLAKQTTRDLVRARFK